VTDDHQAGGVRDRMLVPSAGLFLLVATTAFLIVFTLLNQIGASLHASRSALSWIAIVTVLAGTVSTALLPALGSLVGQRRLMVAAMSCLAAGSAMSAVATDVAVLIAGRAVASLGLASALLSVAIVRERRSGRRLLRALAAIAAVEGAAAGTGFVLGGVVEDLAHADWRAVFWFIAALTALTAALAAVAIPGGRGRAVRRIDAPGAVLLTAALVAGLLPVTEGSAWGWASGRVIGLFAAAALLLAAWIITELRTADPLLQPRVLARPGVAAGAVMLMVMAGTVGVINLTVPSFLEAPPSAGYGIAASVLTSGLCMVPFAAVITISAAVTGRLASLASARACAAGSLCIETAALGLLAAFHHSAAQVILIVALFGAGHGGGLSSAYIMITGPVRPGEAGTAVGAGGALSGVGGAVATAVITPILAGTTVLVGSAVLPAAAGYAHAWLFAAVLAVAGAAVVWLTPAQAAPPHPEPPGLEVRCRAQAPRS
jgi:MFS family permease